LRKEHRLRISENGVLRKIFGLIREDVTGKWRDFITKRFRICTKYEGWNFNSGNYLFTTDT